MRRIPDALRAEMEADPYYQRCCISGVHKTVEKIDWHHNLIFAGKQVNEKWAILPLATSLHDRISDPDIKAKCDWIMLNRAEGSTLVRYSKAVNLTRRRDQLNKRYGRPIQSGSGTSR